MAENIPGNPINPKKETVRINLPPRPTKLEAPLIKLSPLKPSESPTKKTGSRTTPEGVEEFYDQDGVLEVRVFPNGIVESYNKKGKVIERTDREGRELPIDAPVPVLESEKIFTYVAMDGKGKEAKGTIRALSQARAIEQLKSGGFFPTKVIEIEAKTELTTKNQREELKVQETERLREIITEIQRIIEKMMEVGKAEKGRLAMYWDKFKSGSKTRKTVQTLTAAAMLGGGGYGAKKVIDYIGQGEKDTAGKIEEKNITKNETGEIYTSKATNLTEEAEKIKRVATETPSTPEPVSATPAVKGPTYDRYDQPFEPKQALTKKPTTEEIKKKKEKEIENKKTESASIVAPKPPEKRREIDEGEQINPYQPPKNIKEQVNGTEGGFVTPYGATSYSPPVNFGNFAPPGMSAENPFHLSDKMLDEVEEVYENNMEIIFPNDTLRLWKKIKNKSAYELMNALESKIPREHRALFSYLKKLEEKTGLGPRSGVRGGTETIERYMERTLQKAKQKGIIDELKLK